MNRSNTKLIFLSVPGLRQQDLAKMPHLKNLVSAGCQNPINHSFPCVTWPSQANMLTGKLANDHGVTANGFYWRNEHKVEMWTAWNEVIQEPQIWDVLKTHDVTSAAWFPMLSKGCGADYVCMPAPIHQPDGSEDLWCYTKPQEFYGELLKSLEHFPLQHFWGPLANIKSSQWIADSAVMAAKEFQPDFFYIYLPHLDYAAQKDGPDSETAIAAVIELDNLIEQMIESMNQAYKSELTWMIASEYTIVPVEHVCYPNRILREAGLLKVVTRENREYLDFENSAAWALVDHQFSHVYCNTDETASEVASIFENSPGIDSVLSRESIAKLSLNHDRSGEVVLVSDANSWQAYYWWLDDSLAPEFANKVDIHRKPGYDPVELHFDFATKSVPLDANLIKGSHGAPVKSDIQKGTFLCSNKVIPPGEISDTDIFSLTLKQFGIA